MRSVPSEVAAALNQDNVFPITLFQLGGGTTLRYNSSDVPVLWNGYIWVPRVISYGSSRETLGIELAEHTLEIDNYDQALTAWAVAQNPIGYDSVIYEGSSAGDVDNDGFLLLTSNYAWIEFAGFNTSLSIENEFRLVIKSRYDMAKARGPSREQTHLCRFRGQIGTNGFKGRNCGYTGAAIACDYTYTTCTAYGNQNNFGGFPDVKERPGA